MGENEECQRIDAAFDDLFEVWELLRGSISDEIFNHVLFKLIDAEQWMKLIFQDVVRVDEADDEQCSTSSR